MKIISPLKPLLGRITAALDDLAEATGDLSAAPRYAAHLRGWWEAVPHRRDELLVALAPPGPSARARSLDDGVVSRWFTVAGN